MVDVDTSNEDLNLWVEDFLKKRKYSKYELEVSGSGPKGDGFLGMITFIKVLAGIGRQHEKTYNLVVKSIKKIDEQEELLAVKKVYAREMLMYLRVLPAFKQYQLDKGIDKPFAKYPKCYSVYDNDGKEAIILQNMNKLNYELHDCRKPQNLQHVFTVIKNYANYHALSLALKTDEPELFNELTSNMEDVLANFLLQKDLLESIQTAFKHAMNVLKNDVEYDGIYKNLKNIEQNVKNIFQANDVKPSEKLRVITHGDCWNNNMMFIYKGADKQNPDDMVFLDFQLSSLGSPVRDLSYYLYAVSDEFVLQYFNIILEYYLYHLHNFLKMFGIDKYHITLDELIDEWRVYGKFSVAFIPLVIKIELNDNRKQLAETAESGGLAEAFTLMDTVNNSEFQRRIKAVFKHYASLN